jgi:hypothetical protein
MIQILPKLAEFREKNAKFFCENVLKIITLVPETFQKNDQNVPNHLILYIHIIDIVSMKNISFIILDAKSI